MKTKMLLVLMAIVMLASQAAAVDFNSNIAILNRDGNYYYPSGSTVDIKWVLSDENNSGYDMNVDVSYVHPITMTRTIITDALDHNVSKFCSSRVTDTNQVCSFTWTLPAGLDTNYFLDVNVLDINVTLTTTEDWNMFSKGQVTIDTNACDTNHTLAGGDTVSFDTNCTGYGSTATIYYGKTRTSVCPTNFSQYTLPDKSVFGEFLVCYYSVDSLGNTEATQTFTFTADSDAVDLANLAQLALVAVLIFAILATFVLWGKGLSPETMIPLVIGAAVVVIALAIFVAIF